MKFHVLLLSLLMVGMDVRNDAPGASVNEEPRGSIHGKIEISAMNMQESPQRSPRHNAYGMTSMAPPTNAPSKEVENVVVYLEGTDLQSTTSAHAHAIIDQKDAEFVPHVLSVQCGTVVDFINRDNVYHNVFSLSPVKKFNIGRRPTGQAVPIAFDKPGIVEIFCDIHSNMSAYVLVLKNEFFAQPDKRGNYVIDHIPPGTYTIKVWHERLGIRERTITIMPDSVTTANFTLE